MELSQMRKKLGILLVLMSLQFLMFYWFFQDTNDSMRDAGAAVQNGNT